MTCEHERPLVIWHIFGVIDLDVNIIIQIQMLYKSYSQVR